MNEEKKEKLVEPETKEKVQGLAPIIYSIELRDLFAMAVSIGLSLRFDDRSNSINAEMCYRIADAMMEARKKK